MVVARSMCVVLLLAALAAPAARAGDSTPALLPPRRYGYVVGGALALTGLGFGLLARSEVARAAELGSARESTAALQAAHTHAATANLCYAVAGASVLYALALELLPPGPAADAASLKFRF